jgi:hypothetical protein
MALTVANGSAGVDLAFSQTYQGVTRRFTLAGNFDFKASTGSWSVPVAAPVPTSTAAQQGARPPAPATAPGPATTSTAAQQGARPPAPATAPGPATTSTLVLDQFVETTIVTGDRYYVSVPKSFASQAGGKRWLELPLSDYPKYLAANPIGALESGLIDPRVWEAIAAGVTGRVVDKGPVSIGATPAELYQATANLTRSADSAGAVVAVVDGFIDVLKTAVLPVDVAVDGEGRLIEAAVNLDVPVPGYLPSASATSLPNPGSSTTTTLPGQGGATMAIGVVATFVNFGTPVSVTLPPVSTVQVLGSGS